MERHSQGGRRARDEAVLGPWLPACWQRGQRGDPRVRTRPKTGLAFRVPAVETVSGSAWGSPGHSFLGPREDSLVE